LPEWCPIDGSKRRRKGGDRADIAQPVRASPGRAIFRSRRVSCSKDRSRNSRREGGGANVHRAQRGGPGVALLRSSREKWCAGTSPGGNGIVQLAIGVKRQDCRPPSAPGSATADGRPFAHEVFPPGALYRPWPSPAVYMQAADAAMRNYAMIRHRGCSDGVTSTRNGSGMSESPLSPEYCGRACKSPPGR